MKCVYNGLTRIVRDDEDAHAIRVMAGTRIGNLYVWRSQTIRTFLPNTS